MAKKEKDKKDKGSKKWKGVSSKDLNELTRYCRDKYALDPSSFNLDTAVASLIISGKKGGSGSKKTTITIG